MFFYTESGVFFIQSLMFFIQSLVFFYIVSYVFCTVSYDFYVMSNVLFRACHQFCHAYFSKASAMVMSKGVVSLMFSLFPSTITTCCPMPSTTLASSVKASL